MSGMAMFKLDITVRAEVIKSGEPKIIITISESGSWYGATWLALSKIDDFCFPLSLTSRYSPHEVLKASRAYKQPVDGPEELYLLLLDWCADDAS